MNRPHLKILFGVVMSSFLWAACERVPEIERRLQLGKGVESTRHFVELKKWLWTCRGHRPSSTSRERREIGERIEEFVDYFHTKGLSTISSDEPSSILGTAILWKESGYLLIGAMNLVDVKSIECSNGNIPWTKVSIKGFDHTLDLGVLKLEQSSALLLKNYIHWAERTEPLALDEGLFVVSTAIPGQVDRVSVHAQPFPSSMHTGIDDDLILFLPPSSDISSGGILVDSVSRVVGYLIPRQSDLWGTAIGIKRANFSVNSIIEKGNVPQPYTGVKLRFQNGRFIVQQIEVGSPAYRAGLRVEDVVVKWNRRELASLSDWQEMSTKEIGRTIPLTYQRIDKIFETQMVPAASE